MKIVATNDNLNFIRMYDLGEDGQEGPDHAAFNRDITTTNHHFMDSKEYLIKVQAKTSAEEALRATRESFEVIGGGK